ncbi:MAG: hypothetical protein OH363_03590 [Candidatus Parvarchaeota archaeon]|nr:hypothetical protein [Candidatus Jingweiarchaeum tengchongense]
MNKGQKFNHSLEQKLNGAVDVIENLEKLQEEINKRGIQLTEFSLKGLTFPIVTHKNTKYAIRHQDEDFVLSTYRASAFSIPPGQTHTVNVNSLLEQIVNIDKDAIVEITMRTWGDDVRKYIDVEKFFPDNQIILGTTIIPIPKKFMKTVRTRYLKNEHIFTIQSPPEHELQLIRLMEEDGIKLLPSEYWGKNLLKSNLDRNWSLSNFLHTNEKIAKVFGSEPILTEIGLEIKPEKFKIDTIPKGISIKYDSDIHIDYQNRCYLGISDSDELSIKFKKENIPQVAKFIGGLKIRSSDNTMV